MTKHSYFPYTSTYSSTRHNTNKNTPSITPLTQTYNILQHSKAKTLSLTTAATQQTFLQTPTQSLQQTKTSMRHIHTSIVSRILATRVNNKILRTPPPHISSSKEILLRLTRRTLAQSEQINHPSSIHIYTKSMSNHIHHHYTPSVALTHTTHNLFKCTPHTHHIITPRFMDRPHRGDCTAGQMDGDAGWWTTSGNIGLPPSLARVMGVGRQQQALPAATYGRWHRDTLIVPQKHHLCQRLCCSLVMPLLSCTLLR